MLTQALLVALVLGQAVTPVKITDPTSPSSAVTTSNVLTKRGLDVNLIGGSLSVTSPTAVVNAGNSSTTPLGAGGVFLGTAVDTLPYAAVSYTIQSDVISAVGGIQREWSQDNVNWFTWTGDDLRSTRIGADKGTDLMFRTHARYFRLRYTNGATPQGFFRLQTVLHPTVPAGDTMGVDHAPISGDDAILTKSVMTGKTTAGGGSYVDVKVNPSGALAVESTIVGTVPVSGPTQYEVIGSLNTAGTSLTAGPLPNGVAGVIFTRTAATLDVEITFTVSFDAACAIFVSPNSAQNTYIADYQTKVYSRSGVSTWYAAINDSVWYPNETGWRCVKATVATKNSGVATDFSARGLPTAPLTNPGYMVGYNQFGTPFSTTAVSVRDYDGTFRSPVVYNLDATGGYFEPVLGVSIRVPNTAGSTQAFPVGAASNTVAPRGVLQVGGVSATNTLVPFSFDGAGALKTTGPLTDTQLRATPVPVSGPLTDAEIRASPVPVSGPLTDAELRATPVPVAGSIAPVTVTGTLNNDNDEVVLNLNGNLSVAAYVSDTSSCVLSTDYARAVPGDWSNAALYNQRGWTPLPNDWSGGNRALISVPPGSQAVRVFCNYAGTGVAPYGVSVTLTATAAPSPPPYVQVNGTYPPVISDGTHLTVGGVDGGQTPRIIATDTAGRVQALAVPTKLSGGPLVSAVSVTDAATPVPAVALTNRVSLCIYNNGAVTMFIGDAGVTTTTGLPVPAGGAFCDDVGAQPYFAIVAAGTADARVLEN